MKHLSHRILSALLIAVMLLSTLSGISFAAQQNTGVRHEPCTELSDQAVAYYSDNGFDYDTFINYEGDSTGSCLSAVNSELYQKLQKLMTDTMTKSVSYSSLTGYWPDTDCSDGSSDAVLFYSDKVSSSYNREHVWPKSRASFLKTNGGCDLHHLRPTNSTANSTRSNYTFGNVKELLGNNCKTYPESGDTVLWYNGSYTENSSQESSSEKLGLVEVRDNIKGDVARILLYVYVRWEEENLFENDPTPEVGPNDDENNGMRVMYDLDTLLQWCENDPVDTWEMSRNDAVQSVQGNRNIFIDYPEFAWLLFGRDPSLPTVTTYTVTASSNNNAYGTVSLSGRKITATPAEGYYAAGYTVLSGKATVTQEGNVFTVKPESDCSIRINFAAKTRVTVDFNGAAEAISGYAGEAIVLPEAANEDGYKFVGWVKESVIDATQKPEYYEAGEEYAPAKNESFYALYRYTVGGTGTGAWTRIEAAEILTPGMQLVLASSDNGVTAGAMNGSYLDELSSEFSKDGTTITSLHADTTVLTLGGEEGAWTLSNAEGKLLGVTGTKNLAWNAGTTTWTVSMNGTNIILYSTYDSYGRMLYNVGATRFTTYTSSTSSSMMLPELYAMDGSAGTVYYTTELTQCAHSELSYHAPVAVSCTEDGNTAYYTCEDCSAVFSDAQGLNRISLSETVIPATGHSAGDYVYDENQHWQCCSVCGEICTEKADHSWDEGTVTTEPTEDAEGVTTYVCTVCPAESTEAIPALGQKLTVSFSVPEGVDAVDSLYAYAEESVTLPTVSGTPGEEYTFLGWIAETVDNQTAVGTYYKADTTYTVTENVRFKALYQYVVADEEGGAQAWTLLEDAGALESGMQLVLASNTKGKVAGAMDGAILSDLDASFSADNSVIETLPAEALILTLGGEEGAWTLANADGDLLGATAAKKLAWNSGTQTWTISMDEGNAVIYSTKSANGRFLYNVSSPRFTTYTSATSASMQLPQLYTLSGTGTTYYTTEFGTVEPEPTEPTLDSSIKINHSLNLASDISVNYVVMSSYLQGYDSFYLECVLTDYSGNEVSGTRTVRLEPTLQNGAYYFVLTGMTAVRMNDTVQATLHLSKDGAEYVSNVDSYSVASYAYAQLNKATASEELKTLCADLLRYGSAAQTFKGYRTDSLADSAMTQAHRSYLSDLEAVEFSSNNRDLADVEAPVVLWAGKTLLLDSKVTIRYVMNAANYKGSVEELSLRVRFVNLQGETETVELTNAVPYGSGGSTYAFDFDGLLAAELRTVVSAAVYAGNEQVSSTLEYSADTYGNGKSGDLGTLCKALIAYSDSALRFFQ